MKCFALKYSEQYTFSDGTVTTDGFIPHFNFDGIVCPVRIVPGNPSEVPAPEKTHSGKYIYALPGGMGIVE